MQTVSKGLTEMHARGEEGAWEKMRQVSTLQHVCSASRTKIEEQSMSTDIASNTENHYYVDGDQVGVVERSLSLPLETPPLIEELQTIEPVRSRHPVLRFSTETQCLQEFGDSRQLCRTYFGCLRYRESDTFAGSEFGRRLREARDELLRAEQYQIDARYRDAEYLHLHRRASFGVNLHHDDLQLVSSERCNPNLVSIYEKIGDWPAAEIAQEQLLMSLKARGANDQKLVQAAEKLGRKLSIVRRAAFLDGLPFSTLLIEIASRFWDDHIQAGLIIAAKRDALHMARVLLASGANVNARDYTGQTPLLTAVQYGSTAMVKLLLEKNADIKAKSTDSMAVLDTAMHRKPEPVESMLSLVIEAVVDLNERNIHWMTPLAVAVGFNFLTAARLLLKAGADIEARDLTGSTALHEAVVSTQDRIQHILKLLLESGAAIQAQNPHGNTPLHLAVISRNPSMLVTLIKAGAKFTTANSLGRTPLDIAQHQVLQEGEPGDQDLLDMLLEYSPNPIMQGLSL
ncbi:hypothetical protein OEA41_000154 [Lepraria neglecta]|uniref:Ankyrin n=1 Tax=Lepraria neglecta TaxID=209136 RepID=A0AAD9ZI50_9LECA|nr:hypothetical protein OEA41_000154 [Lepraria neglecta]